MGPPATTPLENLCRSIVADISKIVGSIGVSRAVGSAPTIAHLKKDLSSLHLSVDAGVSVFHGSVQAVLSARVRDVSAVLVLVSGISSKTSPRDLAAIKSTLVDASEYFLSLPDSVSSMCDLPEAGDSIGTYGESLFGMLDTCGSMTQQGAESRIQHDVIGLISSVRAPSREMSHSYGDNALFMSAPSSYLDNL